MIEQDDGAGQFKEVILRPIVTITDDTKQRLAEALHHEAHDNCFIARSVNFPVSHEVTIRSETRQ